MTGDGAKVLDVVVRHYSEQFTYHAGQRLTTFRYFLTAASVSSAAYATLVSAGDRQSSLGFASAALAGATYALTIAFARLDRRNEQLINAVKEPLKDLQAAFAASLGSDDWRTFAKTDTASPATRFGVLLPLIYFIVAVLAAGGIAQALYGSLLERQAAVAVFAVLLIVAGAATFKTGR